MKLTAKSEEKMFWMSLLDTFKNFKLASKLSARNLADESCHSLVRSQSLRSSSLKCSVDKNNFDERISRGFPPKLSCKHNKLMKSK